jgi:peptidyl-prolyl cis-trans isomerase C
MPHALFRRSLVLTLAAAGVAVAQPENQGANAPRSPDAANVAATVNGEVIRLDQVDAVLKRRPPTDVPLTEGQTRALRREVVEAMIDDALLKQFLRQHGPKIDPAEVEKHLQALAVSLRKRGKTLAEFYRESGKTEAEVRDTWTILFQYQKYIDSRATEAELRKYHEAHRDLFDGVTAKVSHIVQRVGRNAPPGERATARHKLAQIRADILAKKITFAEAARKYSIDPTAVKGGEIGYISPRGGLVEEAFAKAAFALKVGEVSEPVDTEYGVHLILVSERRPGTPSKFETVADLVRECYAEDIRQQLIAGLRKQVPIQVMIP